MIADSVNSYARFERETGHHKDESKLDRANPEDLSKIDRGNNHLLAVAWNYPELKTDAVVRTMDAVKEIEEEIARHRYTYNIIQEFNTMLVPSGYIAAMAGMRKMD